MLSDWMTIFPTGILSVVSDTFDLWKLITEYLPALKDQILSRDGKLVIRPDSGDPVDIICGTHWDESILPIPHRHKLLPHEKGVIELLWDIFGGTINEQGYKVLDPHIGCIYGDSITPDRQVQIYERLAVKGFAATNIVLGVGSYTYQMNTRDTLGFAAKGAWFEVKEDCVKSECTCDCVDKCLNPTVTAYNIYKDPVTDDGAKKSLKGFVCVTEDMEVLTECDVETENSGILRTIYEDGNFYNLQTLEEIRSNINKLI
jgi:nicotinamide phosphoribosyltransferase